MAHHLLHRLWWRVSGVLVYALIGRSGSGKSYRARLVASRFGIPLIVDDGLLIKGETILAGRTAKSEANYLAAIKTALFTDPAHREAVLQALEHTKFRKILLLGTSVKMVRRMAYRLELPRIFKTIFIEDIASPEEISQALASREEGRHIIPAPVREVSRHHPPAFLEPVQVHFEGRLSRFRLPKVFEKSQVTPGFHSVPQNHSSEELSQIIRVWMGDFDPALGLERVELVQKRRFIKINLYFREAHGLECEEDAQRLKTFLQDHLAQYGGWEMDNSQISIRHVSAVKEES